MVVTDRDEAGLQRLVEECQTRYKNNNVILKVADAIKEADNEELVRFTIEKF